MMNTEGLHPQNIDRAKRVGRLLEKYGEEIGVDIETEPLTLCTYFLADLRHWCDAVDEAFHEADREAQRHYVAERLGEE